MKVYTASEFTRSISTRQGVCAFSELVAMNRILEKVIRDGDDALNAFARDFNEGAVQAYSREALEPFWKGLGPEIKRSLLYSIENLKRGHSFEASSSLIINRQRGDVEISGRILPIERVGIYVPNGLAPLPSTILMGAIPAKIAGTSFVLASFAAGIDGPNPLLMGAAFAAGVDQVVTVGGPQAIMALAVGTTTVPKVDLIVGPGGQRVTAAKALVSALGLVGIDMLAGPSEVCIIADGSTPVVWTAADLLSQMEHGVSSSAYLITDRPELIQEVRSSVVDLLQEHNFNASMSQLIAVLVTDEREAMAMANLLAPEHLLIQTRDPEVSLSRLQSAGSVFLGPYSAEAFGDYSSGTNHVLPTSGQARIRGGLSVNDFQKRVSVQRVSSQGAKELAPHVELLAREEGLSAHRFASVVRRS